MRFNHSSLISSSLTVSSHTIYERWHFLTVESIRVGQSAAKCSRLAKRVLLPCYIK